VRTIYLKGSFVTKGNRSLSLFWEERILRDTTWRNFLYFFGEKSLSLRLWKQVEGRANGRVYSWNDENFFPIFSTNGNLGMIPSAIKSFSSWIFLRNWKVKKETANPELKKEETKNEFGANCRDDIGKFSI